MNISTWSIKTPVPSILLFLVLTFFGFYGYYKITAQDFPDVEFPAVIVSVALPGSGASQLETEVTRKIEDSIATIDRIKHIQSVVNDGVSTTTITFELEKNIQEAVSDVRDAITKVRNQLPADVQEPLISRVATSGMPILTYAVQSDMMTEAELSWYVDNTVSKKILSVYGVGAVSRVGGVDRELRISLDPLKVQSLGISAGLIEQQLKSIQNEVPGGQTKLGGREQSVRTMGRIVNANELENYQIPLPDGRKIRIGDVASVIDLNADRTQQAFYNGKPVVSFKVTRAKGRGEIEVHRGVLKAIASLEQANPDVKIKEVSSTVPRVERGFETSLHSLIEGSILSVLVVWLFLRNGRATIISAFALPLSIIPTFGLMYLMDFSLNTITFLALTLIVGILVDDAIVEVENIVRHINEGKSPLNATIDAVQEIGLAVVATSFTLIAVFLPTGMMGGVSGRFFKQFGWTAAIAIFMSLLVARLLTPMMAAYFMKPHHVDETEGPWTKKYLGWVTWCLDNPYKTLGMAASFLIASVILVSTVPTSFMPPEDRGQITVSVEMTPGTNFNTTADVMERARIILQRMPEVESIYTSIGSGSSGSVGGQGSSSGEVRKGSLIINLIPEKERRTQVELEKDMREKLASIPGARISFGIGASGEKMSIVLSGDDSQRLLDTAKKIESEIRSVPGMGVVTSSLGLIQPELRIYPDKAVMAELGVTTQGIGQAVRIATAGDYIVNTSKWNLPDRQIPIQVRANSTLATDIEQLKQLRVPSKTGSVPLSSVATLTIESGPSQIDRFDRRRNVTINIDLAGKTLGEVKSKVDQLPTLSNLPNGITQQPSGDLERMQELFGNFGFAMIVGVFCVYAVLVLLFHDFVQPVTILMALPLSFGGAFGLMALFGYSMSMPALIGLLMLMGIVTKNSILLVEYAIMARREHGMQRTEALIDACRKRARPIIMTTIAMIAGMMPMALGIAGQTSFGKPMATAVIGGLITSTALSLLVVPVVFEVLDNLKGRLAHLRPKHHI